MKYALSFFGLVAIGLILTQFDWTGSDEKADLPRDEALFTVKQDVLKITIAEDGYLKAKHSLNLKPKFRRGATITWLIDEGTEVKEGDILVEFEKTEVQTQIDDLENSLIQYETELEAVKAELAIQERDNVASLEKAELGLEISEMILERFEKGEAPNQLHRLKLAVKKAQSRHDRAVEQFEQVPALAEEGFFTKIQVEEERLKVEEAQIDLENAQKDLELFETYTFKMDVIQKNADVKDAQRTLVNAKEKTEINLKEKQARVTSRQRQVTSTTVRLDKLKKEFEEMTMKAPRVGIVHYGDPARPWRREEIKVGNSVYSGITIITLPDLSEMQVMISVHEADIDLVKEEMDVIITVDAAKGHSFSGKVTKIASVASSDGWDENSKQFRIEVTMEPGEIKLRAGISARAEIQVEEIPDVIQVPIHAVIAEGGEHFCFVYEAEDVMKRIVKVGKNNNHFVQVLEGLAVGERVLLYDPREGGVFGGEESSPEEESADPATPAENLAVSE